MIVCASVSFFLTLSVFSCLTIFMCLCFCLCFYYSVCLYLCLPLYLSVFVSALVCLAFGVSIYVSFFFFVCLSFSHRLCISLPVHVFAPPHSQSITQHHISLSQAYLSLPFLLPLDLFTLKATKEERKGRRNEEGNEAEGR